MKKTDTSYTKGSSTKEHIVATSLNLFIELGFHATSMRQISESTGISLGGIYNHFQTKDDIYLAVLERYHPWLIIPDVVAGSTGATIEDFVHDAAHRLQVIWDNSPNLMKLHYIEIIEFQGTHLSSLFKTVFQKLTLVIGELTDRNEQFRSMSVESISRAMLGLFFAYLATYKIPHSMTDIGMGTFTYDYFSDAYLYGILTDKIISQEKNNVENKEKK
jgi:AcrR family transcriptional regulator